MRIMFTDIPGVYTTLELTPYEVEVDGDVTYTRYTDGKKQIHPGGAITEEPDLIIRKTVSGKITRYEKAWALWDDRKSAEYIPINSSLAPNGTGFQ